MDLWLLSIDPTTPLPSFFELYLTEAINKTWRNMLCRYSGTATQAMGGERATGETLGRVIAGVAEVRSAVMNGGSLAETMYGCTKSKLETAPNGTRVLSDVPIPTRVAFATSDWMLWILGLVARRKFDEINRSDTSPPPTVADVSSIPQSLADLKKLFRFLFPYLTLTSSGLSFAYRWAYLYGFTPHFSPLLHLAGQTVRRLTLRDVRAKQARAGVR